MRGLSPRLGYYIIGIGIVLQSLGLSSDAWFNTAEASDNAMLSLSNPGDVMLGIGMAVILAGTIIGLFGQAPETLADLRPAILPPVLLAVLSIGSMAFAYQIGGFSSEDILGSPSVASAQECPDGFYWHPVMDHCMADGTVPVTPVDDGGGTDTPTCPDGFYWMPSMNHCMENGTVPVTPVDDDGDPSTTPVCPDGYFWMPSMSHCMENGTTAVTPIDDGDDSTDPTCPDGYYWMPSMNHCMSLTPATPVPPGEPTPVCPPGTFWMPSMNHCMPNGSTPPPTGTPGPTPVCPPGTFWMPSMNHCMPNGSTPPPTGTPTPTPVCPPGTFWMPEMNHCMPIGGTAIFIVSPAEGEQADTDLTVGVGISNANLNVSAPDGAHWHLTIDGVPQPSAYDVLEVDPGVMLDQGPHTIRVGVYENDADSVLVASDEVTFIALDDPDICQDGSVYDPEDDHCDLYSCPAPWVFNWGTLHCDLPSEPTETPTATPTPSCPDGYIWMPAMGHCMSTTCPAPWVFNWDTLYCELPVEPTPTETPTPEPTPSCPDGYVWMPEMGHCMSTTCPPPWVFNWDTLYCELPPELSGGASLTAVLPSTERRLASYIYT